MGMTCMDLYSSVAHHMPPACPPRTHMLLMTSLGTHIGWHRTWDEGTEVMAGRSEDRDAGKMPERGARLAVDAAAGATVWDTELADDAVGTEDNPGDDVALKVKMVSAMGTDDMPEAGAARRGGRERGGGTM